MIPELVALLIAGSILAHSSFQIAKLIRAKNRETFIWLEALGWLIGAVGLLILWPEALHPSLFPRRSLLFFLSVTAYLWRLDPKMEARLGSVQTFRFMKAAVSALFVSTCLLLAIRYLLVSRPGIEGVDFYYYVCTARDLASGVKDVTFLRYFYFPGVYTFWKIPFLLGFGGLSGLQWWYLALISANTIAISAVLLIVTRNFYGALFAALWYINLCSRLEGFCGTTEPLVTLPVLIGLIFWGGKSLSDRSGFLRTIALGLGLGLGVYAKQQGGLLALGAMSLLVTYFVQGNNRQIVFSRILLLPLFSTVTLLLVILLEGHGLKPLTMGILDLPRYGTEGDFWKTLYDMCYMTWPLALFGVITTAVWLILLLIRPVRNLTVTAAYQVLGFALFAGYFSLIPFYTRGYAHYALLSGPMFIIAVTIFIVELFRRMIPSQKQSSLACLVMLFLAVDPFVRTNLQSRYFHLWPIDQTIFRPQPRAWRKNPIIAQDMLVLSSIVRPGQHILVLPPRRNEIHFFLGTLSAVSSVGYGWGTPIALEKMLKIKDLDATVQIHPEFLDKTDTGVNRQFQSEHPEQSLYKSGFKPALALEAMTLWKR